MSTVNLSSSSSDDDEPKLRKKKSSTRRGLARSPKPADENENSTNETDYFFYTDSIYSTAPKLDEWKKKIQLSVNADSDPDEEDFHSIFESKGKQKKKKMSKPASTKSQQLPSFREDLLDLDFSQKSEEQEVLVIESDVDADGRSSPTPPSSPDISALLPGKRKRKKKGVVKAINELSKASAELKNEDPDISIIDVSGVDVKTPVRDRTTIKVRSRSGIQRFEMYPNQSFGTIMRDMAAHEFVKIEQILLFNRDDRIQGSETPSSLNIGVADIVDCHIRRPQELEQLSEDVLYPDEDPDVILLRIQGRDPKSKLEFKMRKHETMERVMRLYAEKMNVDLKKLSFLFDGEDITSEDTAQDMDLEDRFCIDVIGL